METSEGVWDEIYNNRNDEPKGTKGAKRLDTVMPHADTAMVNKVWDWSKLTSKQRREIKFQNLRHILKREHDELYVPFIDWIRDLEDHDVQDK